MSEIHEWVIHVGTVWSLLLVLGFLGVTVRGRSLLERVLAISSLAAGIIAVLALVAVARHEVAYLDAALALALLAFVGTIAATRFLDGDGGGIF